MKKSTWELLNDKFSKFPMMRAGPVAESEINNALASFGFQVDRDYFEFVVRYGGALVGSYPIYGIKQADAMGDDESSVVEITRRFRAEQWLGTERWIVISVDHAGNPIGMDEDGRIWCSDHDAGEVVPIAPSFEEYIRTKCLGLSPET